MLTSLELSGFKSFAEPTTLAFPSRITAIVGPNGSGKSNMAEAIRWVLGEQSMKALRGKKGEDLIWNGSPHSASSGHAGVPRMGKASVTLRFDNADGKIALDFDEVAVSRKIFRDGMNEYFLNDSHVRLKDIVELIARLGLGETKHNIIGQGEVDRMLLSSPLERRDMLEEALGLRVYQLKKNETERKLNATEENLRQAELLLREIKPHLTFLRSQAKKADMRGAVEAELRMFERIYFVREEEDIRKEKEDIGRRLEPLVKKHAAVARELEGILRDTGRMEFGEEVRVASREN